MLRRISLAVAAACAALTLTAPGSWAIVGGHDAAGAYPSVAEVHLGKSFLCTGTLISPTTVVTAGHCGSLTGATGYGSPAAWPPALIAVYLGSNKAGQGALAPVAQVIVEPDYLATAGYDITLLKLASPAPEASTKVAGASEGGLWTAGTTETIVGWGTTSEGGDTPDTLQEAQVPITTDAYCAGAYSDFDPTTMVCAGFPQGGVDTCQGDSGGPLFGRTAAGELKLVGATSFGDGCAEPGKPGVYARVADTALREWIRSEAPDGVD